MAEVLISAISTPPGVGGVAIVRVSGQGALCLAEKMFSPSGKTAVKDFAPNYMYTG
ncbi:MAG: tRNA uridine-5-carboxymethylaminomethyl(34) synthesis GTPase MnmE, partial [Clostridia bacterium]|nr:tRNA uridine-5-carboxymethylaminomethyl(34) synthesis GTPase MnmE [Clostridia bacterium]